MSHAAMQYPETKLIETHAEPADPRLGVKQTRPSTILYMIRHGQPEERHLNCYYGQRDVPLSERGREQSRSVADRLSQVPIDVIYSSDLSRASFIADLLAEPRGLPVRRVEVFRERDMGRLTGLDRAALERDHGELYATWLADRIHFRMPEAENFEDLYGRVVPAVTELVESFPGKRIALACHAGPIRVTVAHVLGMPLEHIFRIDVAHGGIFAFEFPPNAYPRVTLMNG
ncbi:histidine phosphatase family protein [bacterium]|nr:histidine phosphatase family protein [bacterium]